MPVHQQKVDKNNSVVTVVQAVLSLDEVLDFEKQFGDRIPSWTFVLLIVGSLMGVVNSYYALGSYSLVFGLEALFAIVVYRRAWIPALRDFRATMLTCTGRIIERTKTVDPETDEVVYSVTIEYEPPNDCESTSQTIRKRFDSVTVASSLLYLRHLDMDEVEMKVAPSRPRSGIPSILLDRKMHDFCYRDQLVLTLSVLICIPLYCQGAYAYLGKAWSIPGRKSVVVVFMCFAILAPILVTPFCWSFQSQARQEIRLAWMKEDICKLNSRMDVFRKFWNDLGPTCVRKASMLLFPIGVFLFVVFGLIIAAPLGLVGLTLLTKSLVELSFLSTFPAPPKEEGEHCGFFVKAILQLVAGIALLAGYVTFGSFAGWLVGAGPMQEVGVLLVCLLFTTPQIYVWVERPLRKHKSKAIVRTPLGPLGEDDEATISEDDDRTQSTDSSSSTELELM